MVRSLANAILGIEPLAPIRLGTHAGPSGTGVPAPPLTHRQNAGIAQFPTSASSIRRTEDTGPERERCICWW
jgi:hypothetical protein